MGKTEAQNPGRQDKNVPPMPAQRAEAARIARELAEGGFALPGTLTERRTRCGRANCRCHADPPVLHGPYWQWTRKIDGKTITRLVPDEQVADYRQWIDNDRRLRDLVAELEALTLAIADARPGSRRTPRSKPPTASQPIP